MSRSVLFTADGDVDLDGAYSKALSSRQALDEKLAQLVTARQEKRLAEDRLADLEVELASNYRVNNPDMSQAQFDKQVRWIVHQDPEWKQLRDKITHLAGEIDALDADRSVLKQDILAHTSRMTGIGGYLFYCGAEKLALFD